MTLITQNPPVLGFFGKYRPFSNFHLKPITIDEHTFPSNEHYFQWKKGEGQDNDPLVMRRFYEDVQTQDQQGKLIVLKMYTASRAKQVGKEIKMRPDWPTVRDTVMYLAQVEKYKDGPEQALLLSTGDAYLEETNWWHDNYWGNCTGKDGKGCWKAECKAEGENRLGKTLMRLCKEIMMLKEYMKVEPIAHPALWKMGSKDA